MSLDRRIRDELDAEAQHIEPDVTDHLVTIEDRARSRSGQVNAPALFLGALIIGLVLIVRAASSAGNPSSVGGTASPTFGGAASDSLAYDAIAGGYSVALDPRDSAINSAGVGGTWSMTLDRNGVLDLTPPTAFRLGGRSPSGAAFSLSGDRFRTNLFFNDLCNTVGTYTWRLSAKKLTLTLVEDSCSVRSTLLTSKAWSATP